jgi:tetratricopeptide (TPR) repeat protein
MEAELFFNRGVAKTRIKDLVGAIEDFTTAIDLSSGTVKKTLTTNLDDGSTQHVNVFENSEGYANMYFNRACAYMDLGNYMDAIYDLSKVIQYTPNDAEAYFKRAISNYCIENDEESNKDLATANNLNSIYNQELFTSIFGN